MVRIKSNFTEPAKRIVIELKASQEAARGAHNAAVTALRTANEDYLRQLEDKAADDVIDLPIFDEEESRFGLKKPLLYALKLGFIYEDITLPPSVDRFKGVTDGISMNALIEMELFVEVMGMGSGFREYKLTSLGKKVAERLKLRDMERTTQETAPVST